MVGGAEGESMVKVGGSLFDLPDLGVRLSGWLNQLDADKVLLVPGGGITADAIRALDRTHHLGEEASHWLALEAMSINARFLQVLLPTAKIVADIPVGSTGLHILDASPFFRADEERHDHLPHTWQVTSDSLAVRVAVLARARELILLKSVDWPGDDWAAASRAGVVDGYFAAAVRSAPGELRIRVVNLRSSPLRLGDPGR